MGVTVLQQNFNLQKLEGRGRFSLCGLATLLFERKDRWLNKHHSFVNAYLIVLLKYAIW